VADALLVVAGLVVGGGLAWTLARGHYRAQRASASAKPSPAARPPPRPWATISASSSRSVSSSCPTYVRASISSASSAPRPTRGPRRRGRISRSRKRLLADSREQLREAFADLSARALETAKADFLQLAGQKVDTQLAARQTTMDGLVSSLRQDLERYEQHLREIETKREHAYASLKQQVEHLSTSSSELQREAGNLVTALRGSQVAGGGGKSRCVAWSSWPG